MDKSISDFIAQLELGELNSHRNVAVMPLFSTSKSTVSYTLAKEAIEKEKIRVTEIDEGGSVPELRVLNLSDDEVLLLDGEELIGAKQNRVLNTTILLTAKSDTLIPVSCTEAGRWSRRSAAFAHSGAMMARKSHAMHMRAVNESMANFKRATTNQGEVWGNIDRMHGVAGSSSPTRAMKDLYTEKRKSLKEFTDAVVPEPGQVGSLVFVNGEVVGFDVLADPGSYAKVHKQLIDSYAMDGLLEKPGARKADSATAVSFLAQLTECKEARYDAVGKGHDFRYESDEIVGSALTADGEVVQAAFFASRRRAR